MTINTTTIDKVPVIDNELTGEENILIQSSPNAQTMGSRSLNTLKTFFGANSTEQSTMESSNSDVGITYIKNTEYAKKINGALDFSETSVNGSIESSIYKTKTKEQLYIHFAFYSPTIAPSSSYIAIEAFMKSNSTSAPEWVEVCKQYMNANPSTNAQAFLCAHLVVDPDIELRAKICANGTISPIETYVDVISMTETEFGTYDKTNTIFITNGGNSDVITFERPKKDGNVIEGKESYILEFYLHGKTTSATKITLEREHESGVFESFYKVTSTTANQVCNDLFLCRYCFNDDEKIRVNSTVKSTVPVCIRVKYIIDDDQRVKYSDMTNGILSNDDSMRMALSSTFLLDKTTTYNNAEISAIIENENRKSVYGLYADKIEETTYTDPKIVFLGDNIEKFNYYGSAAQKALTEIRLNKSIKALEENCFYDNKNLSSVDMLNCQLEEVGKNAFYNTAITELVFPKTLKSIGDSALGSMKTLKYLTIPYSLSFVATNMLIATTSLGAYEPDAKDRLKLMIPNDLLPSSDKINSDTLKAILQTNKDMIIKLRTEVTNLNNSSNTAVLCMSLVNEQNEQIVSDEYKYHIEISTGTFSVVPSNLTT